MPKVVSAGILQLLLSYVVIAQTNPPQLDLPKLVAPKSVLAKTRLADSLKTRNLTPSQILKIFLPQYTDSFQTELVENIIIMYTQGNNSKTLAEAIKSIYPEITLNTTTKILYRAFYTYSLPFVPERKWPWLLQDTISAVFNSASKFNIRILKIAGENASTILNYYHRSLISFLGNPEVEYMQFTHFSQYIKAGFTASEAFSDSEKIGDGYNSRGVLRLRVGEYVFGMKTSGITALNVARVLKANNYTKDRIAALIDIYPAAEVLAALQAL